MSKDEKPAATPEDGAPAKKKMAGKTLILFIVLPVLLLGGGGAAAFMMMGGKKEPAEAHGETADGEHAAAPDDHAAAADSHGEAKDDGHGAPAADGHSGGPAPEVGTLRAGAAGMPSYYTLPDLLVNLSSLDGGPSVLKLKLTLEAPSAGAFRGLEPLMPRILDQFQSFLRELRPEDLSGSASQVRLRLELLRRVNLAIAPASIDAVLVEEMLVQ
jgi:flagellar FliL protein